ncbi:hypothetical protein V6N13_017201 [Hibiscus sabdariffa]
MDNNVKRKGNSATHISFFPFDSRLTSFSHPFIGGGPRTNDSGNDSGGLSVSKRLEIVPPKSEVEFGW